MSRRLLCRRYLEQQPMWRAESFVCGVRASFGNADSCPGAGPPGVLQATPGVLGAVKQVPPRCWSCKRTSAGRLDLEVVNRNAVWDA